MGTFIAILLFIILTFLIFVKISNEKNRFIVRCLFIAYVLRVGVMLLDLYTNITIIGSGADSEDFHRNALQYMAQGYKGLDEYNYAYVCGIIYSITDGSRLFAQYLNVGMGMGILFILLKIMKMLSIPLDKQKNVMLLASVMPNLIVFSAILLREAWAEFFVILSLYWFLRWYMNKSSLYAIALSVMFVLLSSWMHAGCIFVSVGYFAAYITYNRKTCSFRLSSSSIISLVILGIFAIFFTSYLDVFGGKFAGLANMDSEQISTLVEVGADGGSLYLTWLPMTFSLIDIVFLPIRMFYFLFSPIPFDWRGLNDMVAFLIDSSFYLWFFWRIYKDVPRNYSNKLLSKYLLLSIMLAVAVFSVGTVAAGTAMRHRAKFVAIIFILYSLGDFKKQYVSKCK